jgi:opacity protein-like surface antigen
LRQTILVAIGSAIMAAAALASTPLYAQTGSGDAASSRTLRIGFGGGVTVPMSNAADAFDNGINGQGYLLINLGVLPPLRFNLGYQKFDLKKTASTAVSGSTRILSGVAGLSIDLVQLGPLRPYVTAGVGAFNVKDDVEDGLLLPEGAATSATKFGIDGGAGIALRIGRLEGFVEARVQNVFTEAGVVDASTIRSVPLTFGILC